MTSKRSIREVANRKQPVGFRIVEGKSGVHGLLEKLQGTRARTLIQIPGQEFRWRSSLLPEAQLDAGKKGEFTLDALSDEEQEEFEKEVAKAPGRTCLILVALENESLLGFRVPYLGRDGASLRFKFPDRLVRIERRKDARYLIPPAYEIYVEVGGERHRLLDISRSGLAFFVETEEETKRYSTGSHFAGVFRIQNQGMHLKLEMRDHVKLKKSAAGPGIKIGAKFLDLKDEQSEFLAEYVILNLAQFTS